MFANWLHGLTVQDAPLWAAAQTLGDLGELNARYLLGEIESRPGVDGRESSADGADGVRDALVACNRAGFVTSAHMYGWETETERWLNAVTGYAEPSTLAWILASTEGTPFEVRYWTPAAKWRHVADTEHLPVSWSSGRAHGPDFGRHTVEAVEDHFYGAGLNAVDAAVEAWQVTVFDPEPGRSDLWPVLHNAASEATR